MRYVQSAWNEIIHSRVYPRDHTVLSPLLKTYGPMLVEHGCRSELLQVLQFLSDRGIFGINDGHVRQTMREFDRLSV